MFEFKRFSVSHEKSSMKVGVDAVLIGIWAGEQPHSVLDAGTGCGVIALMLAQRFPCAEITAIDIDTDSIEEAGRNFRASSWNERLFAEVGTFPEYCLKRGIKYDLIVSNPPYFQSGVTHPVTPREKARHQDSLSVFKLIENAGSLLTPGGRLSVIYPVEFQEDAESLALKMKFKVIRKCLIRNNQNRPVKRVMEEFGRLTDYSDIQPEEQELIMFEDGEPTNVYRRLCKDFYLKF